jgi:protein-L-isoaspartate(D-aspartate) O-methyltransferase
MDDHQRDNWRGEAQYLAQRLAAHGIRDSAVLEAIARTPRHRFLPAARRDEAYLDVALGIGCGQTISQPYIVALMTEAAQLTGRETVLEIGTGSGYQAAILAQLAARVVTMERWPELSRSARHTLQALGFHNIEFVEGDGTLGWPAAAPYDAILVTAAAPRVPPALWGQLIDGGRLVIPVGSESGQELLQLTRHGAESVTRKLCDCRFVKLVGEQGWPAAEWSASADDESNDGSDDEFDDESPKPERQADGFP